MWAKVWADHWILYDKTVYQLYVNQQTKKPQILTNLEKVVLIQ